MSDINTNEKRETTALHLQSSHWLTDLLMGLGDGILLPSMWLLATWYSDLSPQQKIDLAIGLVILQSFLHGIGYYTTSIKRDQSMYTVRTDTNKRKQNATESSDVKAFLAKLDIPASIQEQAWKDTEAEKERWNARLKALELGAEKPNNEKALGSACRVMAGYLLGGLGPIAWMILNPNWSPWLFIAFVLGSSTLVGWIRARHMQTAFVPNILKQVALAAAILVFAWLLGRFLIADLFVGR